MDYQNISKIASKCYVSENPNEITLGWADIVVYTKTINGHYFLGSFSKEHNIYEPKQLRLEGLFHWSTCTDDEDKEMESEYTKIIHNEQN